VKYKEIYRIQALDANSYHLKALVCLGNIRATRWRGVHSKTTRTGLSFERFIAVEAEALQTATGNNSATWDDHDRAITARRRDEINSKECLMAASGLARAWISADVHSNENGPL
jgi:hypothetical protein